MRGGGKDRYLPMSKTSPVSELRPKCEKVGEWFVLISALFVCLISVQNVHTKLSETENG